MRSFVKIVVFFIFLKYNENVKAVLFKFTKIVCESHDIAYVTYEYCFLQDTQPNENLLYVKFNIHQLPTKDIKMKLDLMVKSHGTWVPFLYNLDVDVCKFLKRRYNSLAKMFMGFLDGHTNLNHTCPYNHDIFVNNISSLETSSQLRGLPLSTGQFGVFIKFFAENKLRSSSTVYIEVLSA